MTRILTVCAKNRRTGGIETRRWSNEKMTTEDACARMGHWLGVIGWDPKEIMIMSSRWEVEDKHTQAVRTRLMGEPQT